MSSTAASPLVIVGVPYAQRRAWQARIHMQVDKQAGRSRLRDCEHFGPLRVQKVLYPQGEHAAQLLLLHPPGGIAGGDQLDIQLSVDENAHALLTTPGAGKWYKSGGGVARQDVTLKVAAGAALEWLPQETIVFDEAVAEQTLTLDCTGDARSCGWDIVVLGRQARNERFTAGRWSQRIEIRRDGRLLWLERSRIEGDDELLKSVVGWNQCHVSGLMWAVGFTPDEALIDQCRDVAKDSDVVLGVTALPEGPTLIRALGTSAEQVRACLTRIWTLLRPPLLGIAAQPPRIWST
ncbi:MAG: urease accessory protein UreD [Pseudomonadota bacterium]|nr:urease accessory protein UreD [Pseudomonadota bacterium]